MVMVVFETVSFFSHVGTLTHTHTCDWSILENSKTDVNIFLLLLLL